jgi:hypothetical protein
MGMQPIDLQTLYTQLDKVGKAQVQQQSAAQSAREAEMTANKQDAARKLQSVEETDAGDEKADKVHERNGSGSHEPSGTNEQRKDEGGDETQSPVPAEKEIIKDPALGTHIDISG